MVPTQRGLIILVFERGVVLGIGDNIGRRWGGDKKLWLFLEERHGGEKSDIIYQLRIVDGEWGSFQKERYVLLSKVDGRAYGMDIIEMSR